MTDTAFTGERLHEGSPLFLVDLARHHAAYRFAIERGKGAQRVLDLGSGSGYGAAELAGALPSVVGVDRVPADRAQRQSGAHFVRADLGSVPLVPRSFDRVVSFQVIEHLEDPTVYVDAMADLLRPEGEALVTTPNLLTSDRENPFHVHEYEADELARVLGRRFGEVEMLGVGATPPVARYYAERLEKIRRITRLDPLKLRRALPRGLVEWLFGRFAVLVRRGIQKDEGIPEATWHDFPIGPVDPDCLDLLAVCRKPR